MSDLETTALRRVLDIVAAPRGAPRSVDTLLRECLTCRLGAEEDGIDILRVQEIRTGCRQGRAEPAVAVFKLGVDERSSAGRARAPSIAASAIERRGRARENNVARPPLGKAKPAARQVDTVAPVAAFAIRTGSDNRASL